MTKPAIGSVGTLSELHVGPGDVVECVEWYDGEIYNGRNPHYVRHGRYGLAAYEEPKEGTSNDLHFLISPSRKSKFRLISRASDTPEDDTFFGMSIDKFTDEELKELADNVVSELAKRLKERKT